MAIRGRLSIDSNIIGVNNYVTDCYFVVVNSNVVLSRKAFRPDLLVISVK